MLNVVLLPQYLGIYSTLYHAAFNRIQTYLVESCRHDYGHPYVKQKTKIRTGKEKRAVTRPLNNHNVPGMR